LLLYLFGYLIRFRKAYWLISGYNTMSAKKKEKVDAEGLSILMGNMCFIMATILIAGLMLLFLKQSIAGFCVLGLIIPVILYTIIAAQKYDGNNFTDTGEMKKGSKLTLGIIVLFLLLIPGFVVVMLFSGMQPMTVAFTDIGLTIEGSYGQSVAYADIMEVRLMEEMPEILTRTNGSAIGEKLRGHFKLADIGPAMLYIDHSQPLFVFIQTADQKIYMNLATLEDTRQFFNDLQKRME
jgi:hypothetical protein